MLAIPVKEQKNPGRNAPTMGIAPLIAAAVIAVLQNAQARQWIAAHLGIGPSYNAANGGEVARQLGPANLGKPWANSYMQWLKEFAPDIWQSGNVWDAGAANASTWHDAYLQWIAAGIPEGTLFDANMHPKGFDQAIVDLQAANDPQRRGGGNGAPVIDSSRDAGTDTGGDVTPPPAPSGGLSTTAKIALGLLALASM